jgi:hypothetical protein
MPTQPLATKSLIPLSIKVGTSGNDAARFSLETATATQYFEDIEPLL